MATTQLAGGPNQIITATALAGNKVGLDVNAILATGLVPPGFDYIAQAQNSLQDIWTYRSGGAGGTLLATITVTYSTAKKDIITSVART